MAFIKRSISKQGNKIYKSIFLVESYKENGKTKHKYLLNLSKWDENAIKELDKVIHGENISKIVKECKITEGKNIGGMYVCNEIAKRNGLIEILGKDMRSKYSLAMIYGRILTGGHSRLALTTWVKEQEIEKVLGINKINKDQLYSALDWISENKEGIETELFKKLKEPPIVYLYDVSSTYLEHLDITEIRKKERCK